MHELANQQDCLARSVRTVLASVALGTIGDMTDEHDPRSDDPDGAEEPQPDRGDAENEQDEAASDAAPERSRTPATPPWWSAISPATERMFKDVSRQLSQLTASSTFSRQWQSTAAAVAEQAGKSLASSGFLAQAGAQHRANLARLAESVNTRALLESVRGQQATLLNNLLDSTRLSETLQASRLALETSVLGRLNSGAFRDFFRKLEALHARYWPANWAGCAIDYAGAWRVAEEDGIPLVWVPRGPLVIALLEAPDRAARLALLLESAEDVIDDCEAVVTAAAHAALAEHRAMVGEAIAAWRAGMARAAQAAANVAVSHLLESVYAEGKLARLGRSPLRAPRRDTVALARMRVALILEASVGAVESHNPSDTSDWPERYNRHLSAHQVSDAQYTPAHALIAVMLASALVAETDALIAEGLVIVPDDSTPDDPAA